MLLSMQVPANPKNRELIYLNVLYLNVLGHLNPFNGFKSTLNGFK